MVVLELVAFSWFKLRTMAYSLNSSGHIEKFAKFVTRDREGEINYVPNSMLVCVGHLRAQGSPNKETIIQPCGNLLLQQVCFISVNVCVKSMQYKSNACNQFMDVNRMHANYKQNEYKLWAHACKQMFTTFCMHTWGQILTCAWKQKIKCEYLHACSVL